MFIFTNLYYVAFPSVLRARTATIKGDDDIRYKETTEKLETSTLQDLLERKRFSWKNKYSMEGDKKSDNRRNMFKIQTTNKIF